MKHETSNKPTDQLPQRRRGWRKGKVGGKGEHGEGKERRGRGEGINLPHDRLKTLAALVLTSVLHIQ